MSDDLYDGWSGYCHPDAPAGGGGPGFFHSPKPAGTDIDPLDGVPHPQSPAGRTMVGSPPSAENAAKPPLFLEKFNSGIGDYSAGELNEALYAVFGELSSQLRDQLYQEAKAIASTILNRYASICESRKSLKAALLERDKTLLSRDSVRKVYDELAKSPAKYQKELGVKKYKNDLATSKTRYGEASRVLQQAQDKLQATSDAKIMAHSWIDEERRGATQVTLTDVVNAPAPGGYHQYEGYPAGIKLYKDYPSLKLPDKQRNYERWRVAKTALEKVARDPAARDPYMEFRSSYNDKKALIPGRTRIGGNDFW